MVGNGFEGGGGLVGLREDRGEDRGDLSERRKPCHWMEGEEGASSYFGLAVETPPPALLSG